MIGIIFIGLLVIGVLCGLPYALRWWRKRKLLTRLPGPRGFELIKFLLRFIFTPRNKLIQMLRECGQKYGRFFSFVVFGNWIVLIWEAESAEVRLEQNGVQFNFLFAGIRSWSSKIILTSRPNINKGFSYRFLKTWLGNGLITSNGKYWHSRRKALTPAFHFSILETFYETFIQNTEILLEELKKEVPSEGFDIFPYLNNCTLDIICEAAMGVKINAQQSSPSEYVTAVKRIKEVVFYRIFRPWMWPNLIYKFTNSYGKEKAAVKILHNMSRKVIEERKQKRRDNKEIDKDSIDNELGVRTKKMFLDLLLDISENSEEQFTDQELRDEVDTFIFAGHDTTSASLSWTIYLLGSHPDIQVKVYAELREVIGTSSNVPTMKQISELKYLECVIKESLRLFPSVPNMSRTLTQDIRIKGYTIPAGTLVSINFYELHRDPKHFPDPEKFNPDHFNLRNTKKRHPYAYLPFSAGSRNCIGQKYAILEEKLVLAMILLKYKIISLDKWGNVPMIAEGILLPENGIWVQITER